MHFSLLIITTEMLNWGTFLIKFGALVIAFLVFRRQINKDNEEKLASKVNKVEFDELRKNITDGLKSKANDNEVEKSFKNLCRQIEEYDKRNNQAHMDIEKRTREAHQDILNNINDKLQLLMDMGGIQASSKKPAGKRRKKPLKK